MHLHVQTRVYVVHLGSGEIPGFDTKTELR